MATLNQLPSDVDLAFVAGDTFRIRVRVLDPADSSAEDLTAYKFCAEIAHLPDRAIVSQFAISADPDAPATSVILTLSSSETAALPGMGDGKTFNGIWDLEVTFPNNDVRTVAAGSVVCGIDVSHCIVT